MLKAMKKTLQFHLGGGLEFIDKVCREILYTRGDFKISVIKN